MKKLLIGSLSAAAMLLLTGNAAAWQKDPDSKVDAAKVVTAALLSSPEATIGDADTAVAGTAGVDVGSTDLTSYTSSSSSSGTIFWVDNTPLSGDCPQATYPTIQSAVNASGPNDTVKVCPGVYPEQVRIIGHNHDGLKLESLTPLGATIKWPTVETSPLALVYFNNADGVTIRGFVVSGPFTFNGCSLERHEGLSVVNAFDERITHNKITMIRNSNPALRGCQEGDAVAIGFRTDPTKPPFFVGTEPGSAKVWDNLIERYQKNGIQTVNQGSYVNARNNTIVYYPAEEVADGPTRAAPNGVVVFREAAASVEQNSISGNQWTLFPLSTGVILDEAPPGSSDVSHNRIFDNDYGVETDTQTGLEISHNDVYENRADAITLCGEVTFGCGPAMQIVVRANHITGNAGSGIALFGANSNLLKTNDVEQNGTGATDTTDGIRVDSGSTNNQIAENHMLGNLTHDCHDDSTGPGTAGTANYWINDKGVTENRPGLCY
jgi:nitrous oxidase accessory protein NosD